MHIMIIGGAGMLGQKLASAILAKGEPLTTGCKKLTLVDIVEPDVALIKSGSICEGIEIETITGDFSDGLRLSQIASERPDIIYHLAAVVSGEAEANFDKGYEANVKASWGLLEALRAEHEASSGAYCPRVVFSSSLAVYGLPFPDVVGEEFYLRPASCYGTQKAMVELLVSDYSRRGFIDGISVRLPTIVVRPGRPNAAASSFLSSIIREPLKGEKTILPVSPSSVVWVSSPKVTIENLVRTGMLSAKETAETRVMNLPGLKVSVGEMIDGLKEVGGSELAELIVPETDEVVSKIVLSWPSQFVTERAAQLGLIGDVDFVSIVQQHVEETSAQ